MESRWKPAVKYAELEDGIIIDTGYGYKAIRKDGKSQWFAGRFGVFEEVEEFLKERED